jgi:hypothetical protein
MQAFCKKIVIDYSVRNLCARPYPNHPYGCPNFGKRLTCPPNSHFIDDIYDISCGFWVVWIDFDLGAHRRKMKKRHPDWSERQIDCCLYWQGTANKMLREEVADAEYYLDGRGGWQVSYCPEALGVNVTATMRNLKIDLEWPPKEIVRKVAIFGLQKKLTSVIIQ